MTRYFFDFRSDGAISTDDEGVDLSDADEAHEQAVGALAEGIRDVVLEGAKDQRFAVEVRDELGVVLRISAVLNPNSSESNDPYDTLSKNAVCAASEARNQHPLQILLIFLSTFESTASSSRIALSPAIAGPLVTVPSILFPPPLTPALLAWPIVPWPPFGTAALPAVPAVPDEFAVPALLVPGALGTLEELPAPDGSLPELFNPAAFAGPDGMLLMP
jgi:hypothetical protein